VVAAEAAAEAGGRWPWRTDVGGGGSDGRVCTAAMMTWVEGFK